VVDHERPGEEAFGGSDAAYATLNVAGVLQADAQVEDATVDDMPNTSHSLALDAKAWWRFQ